MLNKIPLCLCVCVSDSIFPYIPDKFFKKKGELHLVTKNFDIRHMIGNPFIHVTKVSMNVVR